MSGPGDRSFWRRWPSGLRWAFCFALVLGLHATAALALIGHWRPDDEAVAQGPVILIDLAPIEAAPAPTPSDVAPAPQPTPAQPVPQTEPEQQKPEEPEKVEEPPKPQEPEKPAVTADLKPPPEPPVQKIEPVPLLPPVPQVQPVVPDVVMPPPRPSKQIEKQERRRKVADLPREPAKSERPASRAAAPAAGARAHNPDAVPHWKTELIARLQRYKRYPADAQARGEHGVAQLAFSVDRRGGVHRARIVRSSGSSALDRATLELIERAQPLPAPPPEVPGAEIAISVPINYSLR